MKKTIRIAACCIIFSVLPFTAMSVVAESASSVSRHHSVSSAVHSKTAVKSIHPKAAHHLLACDPPLSLQHAYTIANRSVDDITEDKDTAPCAKGELRDRLHGGARINVDYGYSTRHYDGHTQFGHGDRHQLSLSTLDLYGNADMSAWLQAHVAVNFHTRQQRLEPVSLNGIMGGNYSARRVNLEEGFVTIGNLAVFPVYLRLGQQYLHFGYYFIHPITYSLTQLLQQIAAPAATFGIVTHHGLYGSVYVFPGIERLHRITLSKRQNHTVNYGAEAGYRVFGEKLGYFVQLGYLHNLADTQYVAWIVRHHLGMSGFQNAIGALSGSAGINSGPFAYVINGVVALRAFPENEIPFRDQGAKPWAYGLLAMYGFDVGDHHAHMSIGFQQSGQASGLMMPRYRVFATYGMHVLPNTDIEVELTHDRDYGRGSGGTGRCALTGAFRVAVMV